MRKPAINPIVGDVVRSAYGPRIGDRQVTKIVPSGVEYYAILPDGSKLRSCTRQTWEEWCRRNRVIVVQRGEAAN